MGKTEQGEGHQQIVKLGKWGYYAGKSNLSLKYLNFNVKTNFTILGCTIEKYF